MTGILSWTPAVTTLRVVVRIEHVSTTSPPASFHLSHIPASANSSPSLTSKQYGYLVFPRATTRRIRQPEQCTAEILAHHGMLALTSGDGWRNIPYQEAPGRITGASFVSITVDPTFSAAA